MLNAVLIAVGVLLALLLVVLLLAAFKPSTFRLERTRRIDAPPEQVYDLVADFRKWTQWSPWEKLDPEMTRTYSGAEQGVGAVYEWEGNSKVGAGRMEIVEAVHPSRVGLKLDFLRPMKSTNRTDFTLEPHVGATDVTWAMQGPNPYMFRVMQTFTSLDQMIGKDFEKGLADLDAAARG
jgi:uncharacterized protein YndB with AHSA1/START domain